LSFIRWLSERLGFPRPASRRKTSAARCTFRPRLEYLEDRCVPSTFRVNHDFNIHAAADATTAHGTLAWAVANAQNGDTILLTGEALQNNGITLTKGELILTQQNLTIEAAAGQPPVTISGGGVSRIFEVAGGASVTLSNVIITGGNGVADNPAGNASQDGYGGAILVDAGAALAVSGSTLSGNSAGQYGGGIFSGGTLTVSGTTLSGNTASAAAGGGIYNYFGTLTVSGSTLSGNSAGFDGGGIYNQGTATVSGTTLSGNSASAAAGGGIYNSFGTLTVSDSIFSGNLPDNLYGFYTDGGGNTF
jgi:predicted outer membrane repeat protein